MSAVGEGRGDGPGGAAGETDEPAHMLFEIVPARGTLAFGRAHLDARQQTAEILVPFLVFHEEGQPAAVHQADLGADQRRDAKTRAGAVEGRRSVHTVGVHEGQGRLLEGDGASRQRLGQRRRLEERKCALGMQLDEHGSVQFELRRCPLFELKGEALRRELNQSRTQESGEARANHRWLRGASRARRARGGTGCRRPAPHPTRPGRKRRPSTTRPRRAMGPRR